MKGKVPAETEKTLATSKAGLTLMLADGMGGTSFVRAPLVTNEVLFEYLHLGPFRKEDWIRSKQPTLKLDPDTEKPFTPLTLLRKRDIELENVEEKVKVVKG